MAWPERLRPYLDDVERGQKIDERTYRWIRKEVQEKGVRFKGDYTVRYELEGDHKVTWSTLSGNMKSYGSAQFVAVGDAATEVRYCETIECEMQVNRILAVALRPLVQRRIRNGVSEYLGRVKQGLESGGSANGWRRRLSRSSSRD